jgi:hypothetical protein
MVEGDSPSSSSKVSDNNSTTTNNNTLSSDDVNIKDNQVKVDNTNINLKYPNFTVQIPGTAEGILGGALIKAGLELSKKVPSIGGKMLVASATAGITAGITTCGQITGTNLADKIYNKNPENTVNKLFSDLNIDFSMFKGQLTGLEDYPLNLVKEMALINGSAILFLFIVLIVFIAIIIKNNNVNIFKYLPKWLDPSVNRFSKLIQFLLNRNIQMWYESRIFILIISWFMLLLGLLTNQLGLLIILYSG